MKLVKKEVFFLAEQPEIKASSTRKPKEMDLRVGNRVRSQRLLLSMSQERLATLLGLTFQQVQKYEKGTNRIGASRLFDLSLALGVPIDYFYGNVAPSACAPEHGSLHSAEEIRTSRESIELNRFFAKIANTGTRLALLALIRQIADNNQVSGIDHRRTQDDIRN
jgi:transcriptional regulator with XRE-family HTH domain